MTRPNQTFATIIRGLAALIVLLAIGGGALWCLSWLGSVLGLQATLVWTTVIGGISYLTKATIDRTRAHESLLAEEKRRSYYAFLSQMNDFTVINGERPQARPIEDPKRLRKLRLLSLRIMMIGSDEVVRAWTHARLYRVGSPNANQASKDDESHEMMVRWGELLRQMRRDCGHYSTDLSVSDMLGSFVNDIEDYRDTIDARAMALRAQTAKPRRRAVAPRRVGSSDAKSSPSDS